MVNALAPRSVYGNALAANPMVRQVAQQIPYSSDVPIDGVVDHGLYTKALQQRADGNNAPVYAQIRQGYLLQVPEPDTSRDYVIVRPRDEPNVIIRGSGSAERAIGAAGLSGGSLGGGQRTNE